MAILSTLFPSSRSTKAKDAGLKEGAPRVYRDNELSPEYLPCRPGNVKSYDEESYDPVNGRAIHFSEHKYKYEGNNTLKLTTKLTDRTAPGFPPINHDFTYHRLESGGTLEFEGWQLKLGATPGTTWSDSKRGGQYRFIELLPLKPPRVIPLLLNFVMGIWVVPRGLIYAIIA